MTQKKRTRHHMMSLTCRPCRADVSGRHTPCRQNQLRTTSKTATFPAKSRVKLHLVVLHQLRFIHTTLLLFTYSSCSMSLNIWRGIKCSINMIRCPLTLLFCHPSACNNSDQTLSKALALHLHRPSFFQQFLPRPRPRRIFSFLCWLVGFMNR